jgi:hypothetical protein
MIEGAPAAQYLPSRGSHAFAARRRTPRPGLAPHRSRRLLLPLGADFFVIIIAGLAAALGLIAATLPLLDRITRRHRLSE